MPTTTKARNKKDILPTILLKDAELRTVATDKIDFSPLNYRKYFSVESLNLFADVLRQQGIISPLILRPMSKGRYELVAGERRLRAARIAGLKEVPASVVELTDEQVMEIQLAENLQRENPHPMHEAQAIGQLQQHGKSIDEIAARLGKSKGFVYSRIKLLSLLESFQEMVLADVLTITDAMQIASLSEISQQGFFEEHCANWKKQKNFEIDDLDYYLNHYRYDLKRAPFNTKDKKLVAEAGACSTCPSNSATLKSLFPDMAKEAVCSNKECYNNKCHVHFLALFGNAIETYQPVALLYNNQLTEMAEGIIALTPSAIELPRYNYHEVTVIEKPERPDEEDYTYGEDEESAELDKEEFGTAMEDYYKELEIYNLYSKNGEYKLGLYMDNKSCEPVYFSLEKPKQQHRGGNIVSAKEVQAAIKSGTATEELLKSEIDRIKQREKRSAELDTEKIQLTVHHLFSEFAAKPENNTGLTIADMAGARLVIYQSLDYHTKGIVSETLFKEKGKRKSADDSLQGLYEKLSNLTEQEFSYLIRMAVCCKSESKYPAQQAGYFLYRMAGDAGIAVKTVEDAQTEKRKERNEKQKTKIKELEGRIKKLKSK